jgi:16S rRNA (uracil1498-N3)-methyltransferase
MITQNTNYKYKDISKTKTIRWNEISKNACEQSFRNKIMTIEEPMELKEAIKIKTKYKVIAHEKHEDAKISSLNDDITIFVGPEGGFTEIEVEMAEKKGFITVSLGQRILRSETSSIFLLSIIK